MIYNCANDHEFYFLPFDLKDFLLFSLYFYLRKNINSTLIFPDLLLNILLWNLALLLLSFVVSSLGHPLCSPTVARYHKLKKIFLSFSYPKIKQNINKLSSNILPYQAELFPLSNILQSRQFSSSPHHSFVKTSGIGPTYAKSSLS